MCRWKSIAPPTCWCCGAPWDAAKSSARTMCWCSLACLPGLTSPYVSRTADLAGRLTRRPIPEGTALTADALDAPLLIHRGQNVMLTARAGGLEVRAPGIALADAGAEQRVRVRNLNSLKIVEGVADTAGVVRVTL